VLRHDGFGDKIFKERERETATREQKGRTKMTNQPEKILYASSMLKYAKDNLCSADEVGQLECLQHWVTPKKTKHEDRTS
jgi:hypothetical protein